MTNALIYVRVSTVEQADHGVSLQAQTAQTTGYAAYKGFNVIEVISEQGVSGSVALAERPGGARLMELVEQDHIDIVIAVKLDRLFRDAADCLTVTKKWDQVGTGLHLLDIGGQAMDTSSSSGRFFLTVMAGVAEMERGLLIERTRAALAQLQAEGKRTGSIPYGYMLDEDGKSLLPKPEEQKVIQAAINLRNKGMSCYAIAKHLDTRRRMRSRSGKRFQVVQVQRMLRRAGVDPDSP